MKQLTLTEYAHKFYSLTHHQVFLDSLKVIRVQPYERKAGFTIEKPKTTTYTKTLTNRYNLYLNHFKG